MLCLSEPFPGSSPMYTMLTITMIAYIAPFGSIIMLHHLLTSRNCLKIIPHNSIHLATQGSCEIHSSKHLQTVHATALPSFLIPNPVPLLSCFLQTTYFTAVHLCSNLFSFPVQPMSHTDLQLTWSNFLEAIRRFSLISHIWKGI